MAYDVFKKNLRFSEHQNKTGVLITGGDFQGLGVLRTFGEKKIPVVLVDNEYCIGRFSRYAKYYAKAPDPFQEEAYIDFLINLSKYHGLEGWVVFPNSDQIVYVLSKNKNILKDYYRIPVPDLDVIEKVYIKENTYKFAQQHKISVPKTYYANSLKGLLKQNLSYPVVVKPSIRDNFYNKVRSKAFLAHRETELVHIYRKVSEIIQPSEILVQEYIPGGTRNLYSFCPFFKKGKSVAGIMARRLRQHPMDFGHATTYAELEDIPTMQVIAEKFLSLIGYYGIAEVEFMLDPRNGEYKLIEVNPRVWGWHSMAIFAGIDLPYMLYRDMLDLPIEFPNEVKDVKWIRLTTDIPTVAIEIFKGRMKISDYIKTMKGNLRDAVMSLDDPLPFIAEIMMLPYLWFKRGF